MHAQIVYTFECMLFTFEYIADESDIEVMSESDSRIDESFKFQQAIVSQWNMVYI